MKKIVNLKCFKCGIAFNRTARRHKQRISQGSKRDFCSTKCFSISNKKFDSAFKFALRNAKKSSKVRLIDFTLTLEQIIELYEKQKGKCAYSGITMEYPWSRKPSVPHTMSIDRVDSSKGYTLDNIELVCMFINLGKRHFSKNSIKDFLKQFKQSGG